MTETSLFLMWTGAVAVSFGILGFGVGLLVGC